MHGGLGHCPRRRARTCKPIRSQEESSSPGRGPSVHDLVEQIEARPAEVHGQRGIEPPRVGETAEADPARPRERSRSRTGCRAGPLILARKPRTNRVIIRMITSTAKDVPRYIGRAVFRIAHAASGPVQPHLNDRQPDSGDDDPRHQRREEAQHPSDQRRNEDADHAGGNGRAEDRRDAERGIMAPSRSSGRQPRKRPPSPRAGECRTARGRSTARRSQCRSKAGRR